MRSCPRCGRPAEGECLACAGGKTLVLGSPPAPPEPSHSGPAPRAVPAPPPQQLEPETVLRAPAPSRKPHPPAPPGGPRSRHHRGVALDRRLPVRARMSTTLRQLLAGSGLRLEPPAVEGESRKSRERWPWIVAIATTALVLGGGIAVLASVSRVRVEAEVTLDPKGAQRLSVRCTRCSDGLQVTVGDHSAQLASGRATLTLSPELPAGQRALDLTLGGSSQQLLARVCARIVPDLAPLKRQPPVLGILVEALPDSAVVIDGRSVSLDASGRGSLELALASALKGSASARTELVQSIPFRISGGSCPEQRGAVSLRLGVVRLDVRAPGERIVVDGDSFLLAGTTEPGALVTVEGRGLTVDPAGRFLQRMTISAPGRRTITVRADLSGLAPRLVERQIERVADAWAHANQSATGAVRSWSELSSPAAERAAAAVSGTVARTDTRDAVVSVLWLDVDDCTAPPCVARVVYPGRYDARPGQRVLALGALGLPSSDAAGHPVAELVAEQIALRPVEGGAR